MSQRGSLAWSELKVGLLVIIAFAVLAFAVVRIGGGPSSFFAKKAHLTSYFPSANGLRSGAEVWLDGILVGNVDSVGLNTDPATRGRVQVKMSIDEAYLSGIRSDSQISIDTIGLLGDKNIQIASGTDQGEPVLDGGVLYGDEVGDIRRIIQGTDDLVFNFKLLSDKVIGLADSIDRGEGTLGKLLTESDIHDNLNDTVLEVHRLVEDIRSGPGTAGRFISDDELYQRMNGILANFDSIVSKIDQGQGTAGKLLNDPGLYDRMDQMLVRWESISSRIDRGEGSFGKLIRDDEFYNNLVTTVDQMNGLLTAIQDGDGTAGKLIKDPTLFNSMNDATSQIQKLLYDIQQNPKKYLTINFHFF